MVAEEHAVEEQLEMFLAIAKIQPIARHTTVPRCHLHTWAMMDQSVALEKKIISMSTFNQKIIFVFTYLLVLLHYLHNILALVYVLDARVIEEEKVVHDEFNLIWFCSFFIEHHVLSMY